MSKINKKQLQPDLLTTGFALLLPGMVLTTVLESNRFFQVLGVALLLVASAVFGASINSRIRRKK